ncbi:MAG: YraN family protein [Pseudomonadota bacterium]
MQVDSLNLTKGKMGENAACAYLKQHGYKIIERNFRVRIGEIDIIAQKDDILHFFEVKTRFGSKFGGPFAALNFRKKAKIRKTAQWYLAQNKNLNTPCLFGAIGVDISQTPPSVECLVDAFD